MRDDAFTVRPIGLVRSPFQEKVEAPRQAIVAQGVRATIEVFPAFEHALSDVATFERLWILFWFDRSGQATVPSKVQPPRSARKRGVFATRSPHRPNPIGLSCVRLERVDGCILHVQDLDLLDGTPVLDIKPYLPYADAFPDAGSGWLDEPRQPESWQVAFSDLAERQLSWIKERSSLDLRQRIVAALALGPVPLPYRRIRVLDDRVSVLAVKDWRVHFSTCARTLTVSSLASGYRARALATGTEQPIVLHRAFVEAFEGVTDAIR